ncbi:ABC transporter substrate-binding protein [Jannaschia formosa]|uniref:ABC transporter substrate-binding protein n=1 Tax=Jannaschia formosa TaxID=2259592 RepID=UPI000E1C3ABA|nr:ABC transporter substrate-binding protein [Jannaschia formosa]TFL17530.1 peptide ABC transporter substrate-binding protein [Jannaschia formosa]
MTLRIVQPTVRLEDPHDCTDSADALTILGAVFGTLLRREDSGIAPGLAEAWQVSQEGRRVDLRLRRGAAFSDGTPVDAEAVCANLRRMARPDKGYALGSPGVWHQYLGGAGIVPTGDLSLGIDLRAPVADMPDILAQAFLAAPSAFDALEAGNIAAAPGAGPYRVVAQAQGIVRAEARDGHDGPPAVEWRAVPEAEARLAALAEGRAEVAMRLPVAAALPPGVADRRYDDPTAIIYLFNQASGPLADPRLRRALNRAVDRDALIAEVLDGAARPLHGIVSDAHFGAVPGTPDPFDPDEAHHLLARAGHGAGLRLTVDCPTRLPDEAERLTAALAAQLAPFGVALDIRRHEDREAYAHMVRRKEIGDMCVFDSSPMSTFRVLYEKLDSRVAGAWWQGHRSPSLEVALDRACRTVDPQAREVIYREAYALAQEDPPWLTLYTHRRRIARRGAPPPLPVDGVLDVTRL